MQKLKFGEKMWCQHDFGPKRDFQLCSRLETVKSDLNDQTEKRHSKNWSGGAYYSKIS